MDFYIGTSGLVVPFAQKDYPPAFKGKSRLHFYSSIFNSLEVNSSFYKNPREATIVNWESQVGEGFRFTFKIPKSVSHAKQLRYNTDDLDAFMRLVNVIDKKGCLLLQLPPRTTVDAFNEVRDLLERIRENDPGSSWSIAVEFRDASWYVGEVEETLSEFGACSVIHDMPKCPSPIKANDGFFYFRFHGEQGRYRGSYAPGVLANYATTIREWLAEGRTGYCYFNNTMGEAFANAKTLVALVLQ